MMGTIVEAIIVAPDLTRFGEPKEKPCAELAIPGVEKSDATRSEEKIPLGLIRTHYSKD